MSDQINLKNAGIGLAMMAVALFSYSAGHRSSIPAGESPTPGSPSSAAPAVKMPEDYTVTLQTWQPKVQASGNLTAEPNLQSVVGAPASGRILKILVDVGDRVEPGQPVAVLQSQEIIKAAADLHHAQVRQALAEQTLHQRMQLAHLSDASQRPVEEARQEFASTMGDLKIAQSTLLVSRQKLARTKELFENDVATRQQLEEDEAAVRVALARVEQAQRQLEVAKGHRSREERVASSGALVQPKILEAQTEVQMAREEVSHAVAVVDNFGVSDEQGREVYLRAQTKGTVVARSCSIGQWVSSQQELFQIMDTASLWLWLSVYEQDFPKIRVGMPVTLPEVGERGTVSFLSPQLDPETRTQRVRVQVRNRGTLKVGMFLRGEIELASSRSNPAVPVAAVQGVNAEKSKGTVYRKTQDDKYEPVSVELGLEDKNKGLWEIRRGLTVGQHVAVDNAYLLHSAQPESDKSESAKSESAK